MIRELKLDEIQFSPASYCSGDGRLFEWQGGLYRAVTLERSPFYEQIFKEGVIEDLLNRGFLVETEPVQMTLPGYGLIVQHHKVPFVTYPYEWCDRALKDSALFLLDLNLELLRFGLMTHDVHPWNILFEGTKPIFVDLGSIRLAEEIDFARWIEHFRRLYLRPLYLFSDGQTRIARQSLQHWIGWDAGVYEQDFVRLTQQHLGRHLLSKQADHLREAIPASIRVPLRPIRRMVTRMINSRRMAVSPHENVQSRRSILESLRVEADAVELPDNLDWDYYKDLFSFPSFSDGMDWSPKQRGVANIIRKVKPSTVIDFGSNRGWYSQLAAYEGARVIATDVDELLVSLLYRDVKCSNLLLQPLVLDFAWPSPGMGLMNFRAPAVDRLKCEMALALALVHHLVHLYAMQFDYIVEGLSEFTTRWLLTEFIPYNDPHLSQWNSRRLDWYCLDNFLAALKVRFRVIEIMESDPPARTLIFCERMQPPSPFLMNRGNDGES